ncbi:hypothetical protein B0H15DRAFT_957611 [Mycena belliarum]|uniref:Uncharacterized protein n=1 Tax=Mycena belliarum TaxID=1033014 RepID=A0AAD6XGI1_9AGAR|nr:hypothetical protein B0H15DRAFT_957611 [Mycena belliae]
MCSSHLRLPPVPANLSDALLLRYYIVHGASHPIQGAGWERFWRTAAYEPPVHPVAVDGIAVHDGAPISEAHRFWLTDAAFAEYQAEYREREARAELRRRALKVFSVALANRQHLNFLESPTPPPLVPPDCPPSPTAPRLELAAPACTFLIKTRKTRDPLDLLADALQETRDQEYSGLYVPTARCSLRLLPRRAPNEPIYYRPAYD